MRLSGYKFAIAADLLRAMETFSNEQENRRRGILILLHCTDKWHWDLLAQIYKSTNVLLQNNFFIQIICNKPIDNNV